jgi:tetratricopeptide (TPR) repeat protein
MKQIITALLCAACILAVDSSAGIASDSIWQSYVTSASRADEAGNYAEACKLYAAALKEAEGFGEEDNRFLNTVKDLADAYASDGKFDLSESMFKRLLDIYEKNPKKNRLNIAWTLKGLAHGYMCQARFSEAESLQKRVLELVTAETGASSRNVAVALDGLGRIYAGQGNFAEALPLYERSLNLLTNLARAEVDRKRTELLLDNISTGLRNAADAQSYLGRYDDAIDSLKKSLAIQQKLSDRQDPMLASTYGSMATAYRRKGDYDEADKLYEQALAIYEKTVGPNHMDTAVVLNGLAANCTFQHKYDQAERYYQRALVSVEKALGPEHPDVSSIRRNFGTYYFQTGNYPQAESFYLQALAGKEKAFGATHPSTLSVVNDLARLYKTMGKNSEAKTLYQRLLTADESKYGAQSAEVASDLNSLAEVNEALKKNDESSSLKRRAEQIKQTLPGAGRLAALSQMSGAMAPGANTASIPVKDKWALVVGISKFNDPSINLKYAAKDAIDFKNYLVSSAHFQPDHVKLLTDGQATRDNIVAQLGDKWLGRMANKDDLVVIYISSHGSTTKENVAVNFLVAADTNKNALLGTGIPMQWLSEIIKEQVHSDRVVLVIDVCHSGAATSSGDKGITRENGFNVENLNVGSGQAVVCSSLADQVSWESKQYENSVFTRRLIEGLKQHDNNAPLSEAYKHMRSEVESEVLRDRGEMQTPVLNMKSWVGADPVLSVTPSSPRAGMPK